MIRHQDNKIIFNEQVSFELPEGMHFDPHPETCPSENELHLITPDKGHKLVIALLTVDKSAREFTEEIYEEREGTNIVQPLGEIRSASGIGGWSTCVEYDDEVVNEITLDLPGEPHSLFNMHFCSLKHPQNNIPCSKAIYDILKTLRLLGIDPSLSAKPSTTNANKKNGRPPDPITHSRIFHYPGFTVEVFYPDISEEEAARRRKVLERAVINIAKAKIRSDREK